MTLAKRMFTIAKVHLMNAIQYRAQLLARFCYYTLFIYVFLCLWRAIYQQGGVEGYSYVQLVWYLIMTEFVAFACSSGIYGKMNEDVKSGSIAYLIGRPTHYVAYQFFGSIGQIAVNMAAFGVLALVLGLVFVGPLPTFQLVSVPFVLLSLLLSISLNFFFHMLIGLSAFVLEDNQAFYLIYQKLCFMLGTFLPVEFLPAWLQTIARNLPFSYVSWAPAKLLVDFSFPLFWQILPAQVLWTAVLLGLTLLAYRGGVRRLAINGG